MLQSLVVGLLKSGILCRINSLMLNNFMANISLGQELEIEPETRTRCLTIILRVRTNPAYLCHQCHNWQLRRIRWRSGARLFCRCRCRERLSQRSASVMWGVSHWRQSVAALQSCIRYSHRQTRCDQCGRCVHA